MMVVAHVTGTQAVIKSAHLDLLTPLVSRFGLILGFDHLTVFIYPMKKSIIRDIKKNHSQCW